MVRLKGNGSATEDTSELNFNSTMVRLKVAGSTSRLNTLQNFNSTMVRLKGTEYEDASDDYIFQFHYGTIKRILTRNVLATKGIFQFHYGTIKSSDAV